MIRRGGFTIVELIVTITIMAILMTIGVIGLRSTQIDARDTQRKANVDQIALAFEEFYKQPQSGTDSYGSGNSYPNTTILTSDNAIKFALPDIANSALRAPGVATSQPTSIKAATNGNETITGVRPLPTINEYVYQPLATQRKVGASLVTCSGSDNSHGCQVCDGSLYPALGYTQPCYRFNLFYRLEADNTVYKISSKNQ